MMNCAHVFRYLQWSLPEVHPDAGGSSHDEQDNDDRHDDGGGGGASHAAFGDMYIAVLAQVVGRALTHELCGAARSRSCSVF